jgi:hypothetical protein
VTIGIALISLVLTPLIKRLINTPATEKYTGTPKAKLPKKIVG